MVRFIEAKHGGGTGLQCGVPLELHGQCSGCAGERPPGDPGEAVRVRGPHRAGRQAAAAQPLLQGNVAGGAACAGVRWVSPEVGEEQFRHRDREHSWLQQWRRGPQGGAAEPARAAWAACRRDLRDPLQVLVALACDLELDTLPCCAETHKWAWFRRYCMASRVAVALDRRTPLPRLFLDEVRAGVSRLWKAQRCLAPAREGAGAAGAAALPGPRCTSWEPGTVLTLRQGDMVSC